MLLVKRYRDVVDLALSFCKEMNWQKNFSTELQPGKSQHVQCTMTFYNNITHTQVVPKVIGQGAKAIIQELANTICTATAKP